MCVFSRVYPENIKVDLYVRINRAYPRHKQHLKDLKDTRGHHTAVEDERPPGGTGRSHLQADQSVGATVSLRLVTSVLHRLLDCIYAVLLSRFDPRVQN
jgi:hypothetical protein